jgi:hypothetical protein
MARRAVSAAAGSAGRPARPPVAIAGSAAFWPAALALATLAGLLLRLWRIDAASFWSDEVFSILWVRMDLWLLWGEGLEIETTPPLYYTLLKGWVAVFGADETAARSLSAVLSAATIPVVFLLGRELAGRRVALLAAILFAVTPVQVHYAQEARAYALLVLLAATTSLALARLARLAARGRPQAAALAAYAVCATLLAYTHTTAVFILAALGLATLACLAGNANWRADIARFVATNAVVAVLALPQLLAMLAQAGRTDVTWIEPPNLPGLVTLATVLLVDPFTPQARFRLAWLLAAGLVLALLALAPRLRPGRRAFAFLILAPVAFMGAAILVSLKVPFLIPRVAIWISVPLCILLAHLLLLPGARAGRAMLALALALAWGVGLHGVQARTPDFKEDWRGLSAAVAHRARATDLIVIGQGTIPTGIALYADPLRATRSWRPQGTPERRNRFLPEGVPVPLSLPTAALAEEVRAGRPVWLVLNRKDWLAHGEEAVSAVPDRPPEVERRHALLVLLAWNAGDPR